MRRYEAVVTREGKWWMVRIPEIDGLTQARRLAEAERMAQEYIALTQDMSMDEVLVEVNLDAVGSVRDIRARLERIERERREASELERLATEEAIALARALANENVPVRDVGAVLGVSFQRAHQLIKA